MSQSSSVQKVSVFRNGRSRAIRLPKGFDFGGDEVILRREGENRVVIEPVTKKMSPKGLVEWLRAQAPLDEDFPEIDDSDLAPLDDVEF